MFCYQCQETAGGHGCTKGGVCGKKSDTAEMQDVLIEVTKAVGYLANKERVNGGKDDEAEYFIIRSLFSTITNVNFNTKSVESLVKEGEAIRSRLKGENESVEAVNRSYKEPNSLSGKIGIDNPEDDIRSLKELITYGLKGIAAYADHAYILGYKDDEVFAFISRALSDLLTESDSTALTTLALETGKYAVSVMACLDKANTESFGTPEITTVSTGTKAGKAILISGHDLKDLEELLIQTEGKGINVYTHGEMLPANAYPNLKRFPHLAGNYGGAWWKQREEFDAFPGAILMTTNCIQKPKDSYAQRLFTTGLVSYENISHIPNREAGKAKDFSPVINVALKEKGFDETEGKTLTIGFAHNSVLSLADKVVDAVKSGAIKRFVVMAGCDGRHKEREYFTEVAEKLPKDTVILTAGCAKYRYNSLDLGDIGGIPRVLDAGQCNDSYSLAVIALKLAEVFNAESVNDLPISFNIGWYEQKAVAVLLALLHLGVKGIRLGPTLPAFLTPGVVKVLVENFDIKGTTEAKADIEAMLASK